MKGTQIPWADNTFNIVWGCQHDSPGCMNCYAETFAKRHGFDVWGPPSTTPRRVLSDNYWEQPLQWQRRLAGTGVRESVFCSSMADVFENHPTVAAQRERLWPLIRATPSLDWLLLTKREAMIAGSLPPDWGPNGYSNVRLGVSVENQKYAERRIPALLEVPAPVHFVSCEPLLDEVVLRWTWISRARRADGISLIDWVIVGGESGATRREMKLEWAESLQAQCRENGVAFFFKQRSHFRPDRTDGVPESLLVREFPTPRVAI